MKEKILKTTVYEAADGKQFLSSDECKKYEAYLEEISGIKYYLVSHNPDLTETGCFTAKTAVAVSKRDGYRSLSQEDIATAWAIDSFGYIGPSVMGYGIQRHFCIREISKEEFFSKEISRRLFLSSSSVEGFPAETDIMSNWLTKYHCK